VSDREAFDPRARLLGGERVVRGRVLVLADVRVVVVVAVPRARAGGDGHDREGGRRARTE
jgi:hypothetical protein